MLEGKSFIVPGAGRGIGRAIALRAAAEGARVLVNDPGVGVDGAGGDGGLAQQAVAEIRAAGGQAVASTDSVAEWPSAQRIVQQALDSFGGLDGVFNNAGILRDRMFHQMSAEDFDAVLRVHLQGSFYLSRAAAATLRLQESGAFVHMSSTSGLIGNIGQANYAAAKMGIVGLSRSIALDMARFKVRSNCIAPHAFSRMIETIPGQSPEAQQALLDKLKAKTGPEHVAALAVFLASDAAAEISGQVFGVRGAEVYLYNQPRPVRTLHRDGGWTPAALAEQLLPAWRSSLTPLEGARSVLAWSPL